MKAQRFKRGDVVHIVKDLGPSMAHFENDRDAIIIGSYRDLYGGEDNINDWTVMFCDTGCEVSWYHTSQLTFLRHGGEAEIEKVKLARDLRVTTERDINWILANWRSIREHPPGATMGKLMELVGITNPWGRNGEGITYYSNVARTCLLLDPALSTGELGKLNERLAQLGYPPAR